MATGRQSCATLPLCSREKTCGFPSVSVPSGHLLPSLTQIKFLGPFGDRRGCPAQGFERRGQRTWGCRPRRSRARGLSRSRERNYHTRAPGTGQESAADGLAGRSTGDWGRRGCRGSLFSTFTPLPSAGANTTKPRSLGAHRAGIRRERWRVSRSASTP